LVPVGGTPILDYQLQSLQKQGVSRITVLGGYRGALVEQACRIYPGVEYRINPRYSRGETRISALASAGVGGERPLVLIRGDLIFDTMLLLELRRHPEPDVIVEDDTGTGIGLIRLSPESAGALPGADALRECGEEEPELLPFVETFLRGSGCGVIPVGDCPWARVQTMEDLARALKAYKRAADSVVTQEEERLEEAKRRVSPPAVYPEAEGPARAPASGGSLLIRPLLKVLHR